MDKNKLQAPFYLAMTLYIFSDAKDLREIRTGSPQSGQQIEVEQVKISHFGQITRSNSKTTVSVKVE